MSLAQTLTSLSIAARLRLGFGCLLVLMMGIAAGGLWSLHTVNQQMRAITGPGAAKAKRVNTMLETVGALGIQSRSAAMLNEIDGQQAQAQIAAARNRCRTTSSIRRRWPSSLPRQTRRRSSNSC